MPESAWIIPDDWELEAGEWAYFCATWPKSEQWELMWRSILFTLTRGRAWDRDSGNIRNVQQIGWQIFDRNQLPPVCGTTPPQPPVPPTDEQLRQWCAARGMGASITIEGDDDMGQVVTEIKVIDGKLRVYYGHCCYDDLDIAAVSNDADDIGDDPLNPDNDPDLEYSACGKAHAMMDLIVAVGNSEWDELDNFPWQWVSGVKSDFPGVELSTGAIVRAMVQAVALSAFTTILNFLQVELEPYEAVFDVSTLQNITAKIAALLDASAAGITQAQYDGIKSIFAAEYGFNSAAVAFWGNTIDAIGIGDLSNIAKLGATDTTQDCGYTLPAEIVIPGTYTWSLYYDLRTGLMGWTDQNSQYVQGVGITKNPVVQYNQVGVINKAITTGGGMLTYAAIHWASWAGPRVGAGSGPYFFQYNGSGGTWLQGAYQSGLEWVELPLAQQLTQGHILRFNQIQYSDSGAAGVSTYDGLVLAGTGAAPWADAPVWTGRR